MKAWLVTHDPALAEALQILLIDAGIQSRTFIRVRDAASFLLDEVPQLVLVDDPEQQWTDLSRMVQQARDLGKRLPVMLLSDQVSPSLVVTARRLAVQEFLVKPVSPPALLERVARLWPQPLGRTLPESPDAWLAASRIDQALGMPMADTTLEALPELRRADSTVAELVDAWGREPGIIARITGAANTSAFNRNMVECNDLSEALACLGPQRAHMLVQSMAWRKGAVIREPALLARLEPLLRASRQVAELAQRLAGSVRVEPAGCYAAGRLVFLGEICVLSQLQAWCDLGGELSAEQMDQCLDDHAVACSHALKQQWRIPMAIRNRSGAVHDLPARQTVSRDRLLMRVAGAAVLENGQPDVRQEMELLGMSQLPGVPA